jgi:preprotein translocase subunit SecF
MIEIFKQKAHVDFVGKFKAFFIGSAILCLLSAIGGLTKLNYGVDFRGGAEIQVKFQEKISMDGLRKNLETDGFKGVSVVTIGEDRDNEVLVKIQAEEKDLNPITGAIQTSLKKYYANQGAEVRKIDIVGPRAGALLRFAGFMAIAWALISIMIYVAVRFEFKYGPGAIGCLIHDCLIVLGFYVITGTEFTLQTVAALLTIIGYSINDTVVIYDRIRDHEAAYPGIPFGTLMNNAINETLSRTILTSGATLFVCVTMYLFGGPSIQDFFKALTVGIVVGTYSSIFIASALTLWSHNLKIRKAKPA